jgi:SET domain-containing protein
LKLQEDITVEVRDWIRNEKNLAPKFDKLMEIKVLSNGPKRGRSVVAKRDIKKFEVLGPYSGKLHFGSKTLLEEISKKGHKAVNSYTFSTFSNDGTLSAHGSGNILSLINSPNAPGRPSLGSENVASINVGRYMTFFVAWKDIKKGGELLLDYGDGYDWT